MPRHSQQRLTKPYIGTKEKEDMGYGTKRMRLGAISLKSFDQCSLCLEKCRNPTAWYDKLLNT